MISKNIPIRPGMTAIAAVIALTSTPLLAQDATPQTTSPSAAPTVVPPPVVPTAPIAADPAATSIVTPQPAAPVIEITPTAPAPTVAADPVEAAPVARERTAPARAPAARAAAPRPATTTAAAPAAPVESQPVTPPAAVEAAPVAMVPTPAPVEPAAPASVATAGDETLPLIGAGALAVLALGAAGFVLSRRRRRNDALAEQWETVEARPEPVADNPVATQPAPVMATSADDAGQRSAFGWERETPTTVAAPATLPNGFDISQHGRHVQAAYRGPTPDNPFVSLKKRLTRAHFYDLQEARAANGQAAPASRADAPAPRPAQDRFAVRSPAKDNARTGGFRPAFQG